MVKCKTEGLWVESEVRLFKDYIQDRSIACSSKDTSVATEVFNLFNDGHAATVSLSNLFNGTSKNIFGRLKRKHIRVSLI